MPSMGGGGLLACCSLPFVTEIKTPPLLARALSVLHHFPLMCESKGLPPSQLPSGWAVLLWRQ